MAAIKLTGNSKILFNHRIDSPQATALAAALVHDIHVRLLDLSYNRIGDEGVAALASLLEENPRITNVLLASNQIGDDGVAHLARALSSGRSSLTQLVLAGNPNIRDDGVQLLAEAMRTSSTLTMLDLSHTSVGMVGLMALYATIFECRDTALALESLRLDAPAFRRGVGGVSERCTPQLAAALAQCQNLKELSLAQFDMDHVELRRLVDEAFAHAPGVVSLSLRSNRLSRDAGPVLADLIKHCTQLEELDLAGNLIDDHGVTALCQAMIDLGPECAIWRLDLRSNDLTDLGLEAVLETIAQCPTLQYVQLWGNRFGPSASETLAEVLQGLAHEERAVALDVRPYLVDGVWGAARES